jgi:hypothetical protein
VEGGELREMSRHLGNFPMGASEGSICFIETDGNWDRACWGGYLANLSR